MTVIFLPYLPYFARYFLLVSFTKARKYLVGDLSTPLTQGIKEPHVKMLLLAKLSFVHLLIN